MTDLSERTDNAGRHDPSPPPDQHPAARPPLIDFVPIEGERLEHLATERRGPLRWTASFVLRVQAVVRKGPSAPATSEAEPFETEPFETEPFETERGDLEPDSGPSGRRPAEAEMTGAAPPAPPAPIVPEPMPGSGWSWNPDDEQSWQAWEANVTAGDTERRLASLGTELERPVPAPVRWAHLVGGRRGSRRRGRRTPTDDDI